MKHQDLDVAHLLPHDELWASAQLEKLRDGVRFRVDGIRPDTLRERPTGYERSMVDVISAYHQGELAWQQTIKQALAETAPRLTTRFGHVPPRYVQVPYEEVGALLKLRETSLALIRRMNDQGWERTIDDPDLGHRMVRDLVIERAHHDIEVLELLKNMRYALQTSMRPFDRTISGSDLPNPTR